MRFLPKLPARSLAKEPRASKQQWEWSGDGNASIRVAGHSHNSAYVMAIGKGLVAGVAVLRPGSQFDPSARPVVDAAYWRIACGAQSRVLAVAWNGNQQNLHFLFDFEEPLRLHNCGEQGTVVPASMISAFWEKTLVELEQFKGSVHAEQFVLLGTPPPKSEEAVRAALTRGREPRLFEAAAAAGESVETIRITPTAVRVGLWTILQGDLEAWAARIGAIFVPVPASAHNADGCLKPEYSYPDVSHANGEFGALMLGEIEAALARTEEQQGD